MTTYIIYEGPSALDGEPIVALAQEGSKNSKTGDMMQTYIMRSDIDPISANRTGADFSICGACPLRGEAHDGSRGQAIGRGCYVTLAHGPSQKFKALLRGRYSKTNDLVSVGRGQDIRIGAYGDGMAVPHEIWDDLLSEANSWTGYTHQHNKRPEIYMTSVENLLDAQLAWARGERTFRVVSSVDEIHKNEVLCPASAEAGKRTTCVDCRLCRGTSIIAKSIAIPAHGTNRKNVAYETAIAGDQRFAS